AEKSALSLRALADRAQQPMLPIAIGGCHGWRRNVGNCTLPEGSNRRETGPSPDFDLIAWTNRAVILLFDSNARSNPDVRKARWALARELVVRGATVLTAGVPDEPRVNGPDDLIAIAGDETAIRTLDSARPFADCATPE